MTMGWHSLLLRVDTRKTCVTMRVVCAKSKPTSLGSIHKIVNELLMRPPLDDEELQLDAPSTYKWVRFIHGRVESTLPSSCLP